MKFETLKQNKRKKFVIGLVVLVAVISTLSLVGSRAKYRTTQSIKIVEGTIRNYSPADFSMIAVKLENDSGEYDSSNTIPESGYVLNETESYCTIPDGSGNNINDSSIILEYKNGAMYFGNVTTKGTKCYLYFDIPLNASEEILALYASGSSSLIADESGNVRYYGANPDNYVTFNNELWRIIGVFDVSDGSTTEKRVKLIRNDSIGDYSWDSSANNVNDGLGVNEWSQADLMTTLNSGAYWNRISGTCYNSTNNSTTSCDFSTTGLTSDAKALISNAVWNTGSQGTASYETIYTKDFYAYERSTNTSKICSSGQYCTDSVTRTTSWTGKVGLMYPSDYGYATSGGSTTSRDACLSTYLYSWNSSSYSDCKNNDWLYKSSYNQWTLTPSALSSYNVDAFYVDSAGHVLSRTLCNARGIRPTIYLISTATITGGKGTTISPYTLSAGI